MSLQAVFFDFDGIVVNSEPLHYRAFARVFEPEGLAFSWEIYCGVYLGFDDRDVVRERFREAGRTLDEATMRRLMQAKASAFLRLIEEEGAEAYPGVVELIRALSRRVPLAICSGALRSDIEPILAKLGIAACFHDMVTADQVQVSKPDPESYREGFSRISRKFPAEVTVPARCLAIEDTPAGIAAARGAGLRVLAVTNTYEADELTDADWVVSSLAEVDPDRLHQLMTHR